MAKKNLTTLTADQQAYVDGIAKDFEGLTTIDELAQKIGYETAQEIADEACCKNIWDYFTDPKFNAARYLTIQGKLKKVGVKGRY